MMPRPLLKSLMAGLMFAIASQAGGMPQSGSYKLNKTYAAPDWFDQFEFFSEADPTHGFVKYVDMATANQTGLAGFAFSKEYRDMIYLGVDYSNLAPNGRPSTRIESKDLFNATTLWVADIHHMPGGICGVWPAFWLLGRDLNWPLAGEVDILESINTANINKMVLHTGGNFSVSNFTDPSHSDHRFSNSTAQMRGKFTNLDCTGSLSGNTGCVVEGSEDSFGTGFNDNGGGVIATELTPMWIKIWNFRRGEAPFDVLAAEPRPQDWREPDGMFVSTKGFDAHFFTLSIIFNIDFCGDWAGKTWSTSECASLAPTCQEYVQNNPQAFQEAYWLIQQLRVYKRDNLTADNTTYSEAGHNPEKHRRHIPRR